MVVTIHATAGSPPCRAVFLTAKALDLPIKNKEVNVLAGETRTPEFVKLNPQHSVPTMEDNGLVIAESRAIMSYLCDAYGKTDSLYPKNAKKRVLVDARMYFDATTLYPRAGLAYLMPLFRGTEKDDAKNLPILDEGLTIFNTLIGDNALYLVGDNLTIADITCAVTISNLEACNHDLSKFKNIVRWFNNAKKVIPGYSEINQKAVGMILEYYKAKFPSN